MEYEFVRRTVADIHVNGTSQEVDLLRVNIRNGIYEVIMNCGQNPKVCVFKRQKTCCAPITLKGKKHQITAVLCSYSAPGIEEALTEYGGIKEIPFVGTIRISSRKRYPRHYLF